MFLPLHAFLMDSVVHLFYHYFVEYLDDDDDDNDDDAELKTEVLDVGMI